MSNNTKPGLVAAISVGGAIKHALSGTNPLEVLEPIIERVAAGDRAQLRKRLAAAIELRPGAAELASRGFYFQDWVSLEDGDCKGWMIVFPTEVVS